MSQIYSDPNRAGDPYALPDVETWYVDAGGYEDAGWYWWYCLPGCLPDGEPNGPFATEQDAIDDAQEATQ